MRAARPGLGVFAFAGFVAGALAGLVDGARAAILVGVDLPAGVLASLLAASVDAALGLATSTVAALLWRVAVWGRAVRAPPWTQWLVLAAVGGGAVVATEATFSATLTRQNRFLAGGVTATVLLGAVGLGALLAPALARALSPRRDRVVEPVRADAIAVLLIPFVLAVGAVMVVSAAAQGRPPLGSPGARQIAVQLAFVAAVLPALLLATESLHIRRRVGWAAPLAAAVYGGGAVLVVVKTWSDNLRFLPWTDLLCGAAIIGLACGVVVSCSVSGRTRAPGRWWMRLVAVAVVVVTALATSESEPARKAIARAGLVAPVLQGARLALDFDHDGYARWFGGGDCDDGDPGIHPGALDLPDDGVDQDCDGQDASAAAIAPKPFAVVPDAVPRDLNILLITIDTVRADHLGCYGYARPTSPSIDALAADAGLFVNGWAHAPSTRYSMPAIATGRWPSAIKWDESIWWPRIAPSMRTLAEALKSAGYVTAAFYSFDYFSVSERRGFERGVDFYRADRATLHRAVNGPMESRGSSSREMADDAIAFFEAHPSDKVFLWVHFYDPHLSYEPHAEVPTFGAGRMDLYDGEIRFTDLHVGRLLARLRELGLYDRTAIVVTGDHGEGFGEHGVTEHGFDLYAAQTKVPFIVRVPGLAPRRILAPAGHVDLAPTLLNLARGAQEPAFLGRSLIPELAGQGDQAASVFQEVTSERGKKRALVTKDWHLVWNLTPENTTECFDLRADPQERGDLWGRSGMDACRQMKRDLQGMVSALSVAPEAAARLKQSVFPPGATLPAVSRSIGAAVGDMVSILGATVTPPDAVRGGEVEVALLFECRKPVTGGWRLFFHLIGPGGSFRNLDHVPVDGALPIDAWRKGQRILDRMKVEIPAGTAPGEYRVITGLYRGAERLPVSPAALSDGKNAVVVATIQVR